MTVPTNHLIRFFAAVAVGVMAAPASVLAAPVAAADDVVANDLNAEGDDDEDDCDDDNDDCDAEAHVDGGCSGTIAPDLGQSIGGLLCTLGLLGWQLRRRRP